jgi:hypothetical protein
VNGLKSGQQLEAQEPAESKPWAVGGVERRKRVKRHDRLADHVAANPGLLEPGLIFRGKEIAVSSTSGGGSIDLLFLDGAAVGQLRRHARLYVETFIAMPHVCGLPWHVPIFRRPGSPNLQRSELRVSRFLAICSTRSKQKFESGETTAWRAAERKPVQGFDRLPYRVMRGLAWSPPGTAGKTIMRAPCGAERECGWAGMYRPSSE